MMAKIENILGKPIWVRRNNGASLTIAGGIPIEIPVTEWETNPMLKKLAAQGALRRRELPERSVERITTGQDRVPTEETGR